MSASSGAPSPEPRLATAPSLPPGPRLPRALQSLAFLLGGNASLKACRRRYELRAASRRRDKPELRVITLAPRNGVRVILPAPPSPAPARRPQPRPGPGPTPTPV